MAGTTIWVFTCDADRSIASTQAGEVFPVCADGAGGWLEIENPEGIVHAVENATFVFMAAAFAVVLILGYLAGRHR